MVLALVVGYAGIRAGGALRARNAPPLAEAPDFPFMPGDVFPDVLLADSLGAGVGSIELVSGRGGAVVLFLDPTCEGCAEMATRWERAVYDGVIEPGRVFGITAETAAENARYRAGHGLSYPIYQDVEAAFLVRYGVDTYPMEIVVNRMGTVQAVSTDSRTPIDGGSIRALIDN
ncbi:MAG: peroxiredoxin family protein [Candidatus Krumholzibacteria bacterium]|nr:peroxiredoxin family protein [Candidatus Krumholzibacteria bacterium]MDH4337348.1 peroxiredoxin family protein [Candidatus Krumholzibacteria bacterium]